jgi:pyruvate dehydrogenase E2 component (dihydrolipoamide acetyltransferase)
VKVGAPLVEFAEGAEQDTGTIVGELGSGEHPPASGISSERSTGRQPQVFPAVRALARKLDVDLESVKATGPGGTLRRVCPKPLPPSPYEACGARWPNGWLCPMPRSSPPP